MVNHFQEVNQKNRTRWWLPETQGSLHQLLILKLLLFPNLRRKNHRKYSQLSNYIIKGGGANGYFFVKLDFEIAVDQQTRTSDRTFEGVPDPNRQTVPAGQPRPYLVQIRPNLAKYPEHAQNPYFMCSTCS